MARYKTLSLKDARRSLEMTQVELAEKIEVSSTWYHLIEAGKKSPSEKLTKKIVDFFKAKNIKPEFPAVDAA